MAMRKIPFQVLGKKWTLRLLAKKKYKQTNGADSLAITDVNKRRVDLGPDGRDYETIAHEVWHCFIGELCLHSADIDDDAMEEISAELFSKRGKELISLSEKLYSQVCNGHQAPDES